MLHRFALSFLAILTRTPESTPHLHSCIQGVSVFHSSKGKESGPNTILGTCRDREKKVSSMPRVSSRWPVLIHWLQALFEHRPSCLVSVLHMIAQRDYTKAVSSPPAHTHRTYEFQRFIRQSNSDKEAWTNRQNSDEKQNQGQRYKKTKETQHCRKHFEGTLHLA